MRYKKRKKKKKKTNSSLSVIGKKVNLAARLMTNYPKRIVCDDNTRSLSTLDPLDFHILPYIKVNIQYFFFF